MLTRLTQPQERWSVYPHYAQHAGVDLPPPELWLLARLGSAQRCWRRACPASWEQSLSSSDGPALEGLRRRQLIKTGDEGLSSSQRMAAPPTHDWSRSDANASTSLRQAGDPTTTPRSSCWTGSRTSTSAKSRVHSLGGGVELPAGVLGQQHDPDLVHVRRRGPQPCQQPARGEHRDVVHVDLVPRQGHRAVVLRRLRTRLWETPREKRILTEIDADEVALSLRWATARPERAERSRNGQRAAKRGQFNDSPPF
jgi:hypothetical protein